MLQGGRPVACASRALTDREQAYAQIEKEMLAIVFTCSEFHKLLFGRKDVTLETDHLPLLRIFGKKPITFRSNEITENVVESSAIHFQTSGQTRKRNVYC